MESSEQILARRRKRAGQIEKQLRQQAGTVLAQYPVDAAYLYGSVARGTPLATSDVDVAVLWSDEETLTPYNRLRLELALQAELEDRCQIGSVDVRTLNDAPLLVKGRIIQEGKLIYEKDHTRRVNFEVITRKKYFDYLPLAERMQEAFWINLRDDVLPHGE